MTFNIVLFDFNLLIMDGHIYMKIEDQGVGAEGVGMGVV